MKALAFWKAVIMDTSNLLEQFIALLNQHAIRYCVIGGQGVNAYVEPLVSLDLGIVVATDQVDALLRALDDRYIVKTFPHSINIEMAGSDLRIQIQRDKRYTSFVDHASPKTVLGLEMSAGSLEDILQGKVWAAQDASRRGSKRQKDLADIARIIEAYPYLREKVPADIPLKLD